MSPPATASCTQSGAIQVPRDVCVTCLVRVGRPRATVLKAVVCGPCWAAHGGHPDAAEIGPTPSETAPSCDPTDQKHWLHALARQTWVQAIRADGQRNLLAVAGLVALYAQWDTLESRPTWAKLITRSGLAERTVARWLQELRVRGWLAHLEHGSTPATRPLALAWLHGNRAALYGLRIPLTPQEALHQATEDLATELPQTLDQPTPTPPQHCSTDPAPTLHNGDDQVKPDEAGDETGSLPWSCKDFSFQFASGSSRARQTVDNSPNTTRHTETTQLTALRAGLDQGMVPDFSTTAPVGGYQMLAAAEALRRILPVFIRCSRKLIRHLVQPYWQAGWTNRDITWALDHRPSVFNQPAGVLLSPEHIISPAQFIASRLRAWRTPTGAIPPGHRSSPTTNHPNPADGATPRQLIAQRHGHAGARLLRAGETTLTAERISEHGRAHRLPPQTDPHEPQPHDRHANDRRAAQLITRTRAELTRAQRHGGDAATSPCPGGAYERALARARTSRPAAGLPRRRRG